jgi:uncharacterized protein (DUF302 family)
MKNQFSRYLFVFIVAVVIGSGATLLFIQANLGSLLVVEVQSPLGFDETLTHIETRAKSIKWKVPKKWKANFQKNFKKIAKKDIGPMRLLKMCEPFIAADLLIKDENKYLSVMMPCTFAVYQKSDGKTYIAMMNLELFGKALGGDVIPAMEKAWPDMLHMIDFSTVQTANASES